jgi:hypothetical protein
MIIEKVARCKRLDKGTISCLIFNERERKKAIYE